MADYLFYLSYARPNRDAYLLRFYEDLVSEIRRLTALPEERIAFFDHESIRPGDRWVDVMAEALQRSQTLVSLCSHAYFKSETCGRELQFFLSRVENSRGGGPLPGRRFSPILPVMWLPFSLGELPPALAEIQFAGWGGSVYRSEGLCFMMRRKQNERDYFEFLRTFAQDLVKTTKEEPLPPLPNPPRLGEVRNAFAVGDAAEETSAPPVRGPETVRLVYVAASMDEMSERQAVWAYGKSGGHDWRPFLPASEKSVGVISAAAASEEELFPQMLRFDESLVGHVRESEEHNESVVLLLDPWTLRLERYRRIMEEFAQNNFFNRAVIVVWNPLDEETTLHRPELEDEVTRALGPLNSDSLKFDAASPEELSAKLSEAVSIIRMRILQMARPAREGKRGVALPSIKLG